jgi:hypothetical protein
MTEPIVPMTPTEQADLEANHPEFAQLMRQAMADGIGDYIARREAEVRRLAKIQEKLTTNPWNPPPAVVNSRRCGELSSDELKNEVERAITRMMAVVERDVARRAATQRETLDEIEQLLEPVRSCGTS